MVYTELIVRAILILQGEPPSIVDEELILEMSQFLKEHCTILCGSYLEATRSATKGDIVYFDPPYDYEDESGFAAYQKEGWTRTDLEVLYTNCLELVNRGVKVVVSNNATAFVKDLFSKTNQFEIREINVQRGINNKKVLEVIIVSK